MMKTFCSLFFSLLFSILLPAMSFCQTSYTFVGNGHWSNAANWTNLNVPPANLPGGDTIFVHTAATDSCVLDIAQTISQGASLIIVSGSNFIIAGGIIINNNNSITSVTICSQVWMQKNLDVAYYRNGDPIPQVTDSIAWQNLTTGAWCWYNNDSATYASTYGRLYNWYAVNDARGLAPIGWHIPSYDEWAKLIDTCLGTLPGGKMKEMDTTHWNSPNEYATNSSGFTALPGGSYNGWAFYGIGRFGNWWTSSELGTGNGLAKYLYLENRSPWVTKDIASLTVGYAVRCVRD